jgi:3-hydroxyacyl-CoA dehydrogenase/enoyl-CoA hydratase/3-hydroxybutyryl-CoA epimerase
MIRYLKDKDGIVVLTLDMEGRQHNVLNHKIIEAFVPVMEQLQSDAAKGLLKGVIVTSAKRTFLNGGDLDYLYEAEDPQEIFSFTEKVKKLLRDMERPGLPVVAAMNGSTLGLGFEFALATHYRLTVNNAEIKMGLPQTRLGLIPGNGGMIRLMWNLGIEKAFRVAEEAKYYNVHEAKAVGIVDKILDSEAEMMEYAKKWILENPRGIQAWDKRGGEIPDGAAHQHDMGRRISLLAAEVAKKYKQKYPAIQVLLNVLSEGSRVDFDTASKIETRYFTELLISKTCKNMMKTLWFDAHEIFGGCNRPSGYGKFRPRRVGIIGAGVMGTAIAVECLINGMEVVLKDVSSLIAERGVDLVKERLTEMESEGLITNSFRTDLEQGIIATEDNKTFKKCDLVIEAVFENQFLKSQVVQEAADQLDDYAVMASNTISIPITKLANSIERPDQFVGLHFFAPVDSTEMVEIVKGAQTSDETVAKAFDFVKAIKKYPIIVKDGWGFYVSRVRNTYLLEGMSLLMEGCPASVIENVAKGTGMPYGPLSLADRLSLELVLKYEKQAAELYGPKYIQHPAVNVIEQMLEMGRSGGKSEDGFYHENEEGERRLWKGLANHFKPDLAFDPVDIEERLMIAQVIEVLWCLQEKVISSVEEANLGSIYGWGFPAFRGGAVQYINDFGKEAFVERCKELEEKYGPRFSIPSILFKLQLEKAEKVN